ncbi:hypothetical protein Q7P37_005837 [Cladosporium fusiforme]
MSSSSIAFLTVYQQPAGTPASGEKYNYTDVLSDALGVLGSNYSASPQPIENTIFLWESGCHLNGSGTRNCTLACANTPATKSFWNDSNAMFTVHNCLVYPILATASRQGWLVNESSEILNDFGIVDSDVLPVNDLTRPGEKSWSVVNKCMADICHRLYTDDVEAAPKCSASHGLRTAYSIGPSGLLWHRSMMLNASELCELGRAIPNPDLAGPGILIACMQETMILLLLWMGFSISRGVRVGLEVFNQQPTRQDPQQPSNPPKQKVTSASEFYKFQKGVLIAGIAAFQKTQVFSTLAIQIVALHAVRKDRLLQAATYYQVSMNLWFIAMVSVAGVYPVILGLVILRKAQGRLEWFLLAASITCAIVSSHTWAKALENLNNLHPNQLEQDGPSPSSCGGANPLQHCSVAASLHKKGALVQYRFLQQYVSAGPLCLLLF